MDEAKSLHIHVEGHVQGVGFRYFVLEKAQFLNLTGWVRNRYDGSVEIVAQGTVEHLNSLLEAVREGPSRGFVSAVKHDWVIYNNIQYSQFSMLPTE
jgi:acylphosphatase